MDDTIGFIVLAEQQRQAIAARAERQRPEQAERERRRDARSVGTPESPERTRASVDAFIEREFGPEAER